MRAKRLTEIGVTVLSEAVCSPNRCKQTTVYCKYKSPTPKFSALPRMGLSLRTENEPFWRVIFKGNSDPSQNPAHEGCLSSARKEVPERGVWGRNGGVRKKGRKDTQKKNLGHRVTRRRTNVQQLTCKIDLPFSFYYLFFSFVFLELKPLVLKGKVPGEKL